MARRSWLQSWILLNKLLYTSIPANQRRFSRGSLRLSITCRTTAFTYHRRRITDTSVYVQRFRVQSRVHGVTEPIFVGSMALIIGMSCRWNTCSMQQTSLSISRKVGHFNFWLSLSLSDSLSETLSWMIKSGLGPKFNLTSDLDCRWAKVNK